MRYLKSVSAGAGLALLTGGVYLASTGALGFHELGWGGYWALELPLSSLPLLAIATVAFTLGFFWMLRRSS